MCQKGTLAGPRMAGQGWERKRPPQTVATIKPDSNSKLSGAQSLFGKACCQMAGMVYSPAGRLPLQQLPGWLCCSCCFKILTGKVSLWFHFMTSKRWTALKKKTSRKPDISSQSWPWLNQNQGELAFGKSRCTGPGSIQNDGCSFQVTPLCRPRLAASALPLSSSAMQKRKC